jgi:hypothetical protein
VKKIRRKRRTMATRTRDYVPEKVLLFSEIAIGGNFLQGRHGYLSRSGNLTHVFVGPSGSG